MISTFAEPNQLWLTLSSVLQTDAWQFAQSAATAGGRWQIYLNHLSLQSLLSWFQRREMAYQTVFPSPVTPASSWELVNGSCVRLGDRKLAFIPTDELGHDTFEVPQEWVDIPAWSVDYLVAVKVNPEAGWSECWGYTTHQQLKTQGHYDTTERTVSLHGDQLSRNLNVLWATLESCPTVQVQAEIAPVAELSAQQASQLIGRLAQPGTAFPRLSIPFAQWGALLSNERWREQLYQQLSQQRAAETAASSAVATQLTHLGRWMQTLGESLRETARETATSVGESLSAATSPGWTTAQLAMRSQSQLPVDAIAGTQAKTIRLGNSPSAPQFRLVVSCQVADDNRLSINVEMHPCSDEPHLPAESVLSLIAHDGRTLQSVRSREADLYIRLKQFKCPTDYEFSVMASLAEDQHIEQFKA